MRPIRGQRGILALVLCAGALLLLARCESGSAFDTSLAEPPARVEEQAPSAAERPLEQGLALISRMTESLGRIGLLLVLLAVGLALAVLLVVLLIRGVVRRRRLASEPPVDTPAHPPLLVRGDAPDAAGGAPDLTGDAPGQAGAGSDVAGKTQELPVPAPVATLVLEAVAGEAPGQAGGAPGQAGGAPGQAGGAPGIRLTAEGLTIGRALDNGLVLDATVPGADTVSRHHARIVYVDGTWIVEDLGSQNGVYVMGRRTGRNQLQDGWSLSIGGVPFIFHLGEVEVLS